MNKKLKVFVMIFIILINVILLGKVHSATIKMHLTSNSELVPGDIVVINFNIKQINAGEGIDAIIATLDYDKNVFEEVNQLSFIGKNKWSVGMYDTKTQIFTVFKSSKINLPSDVLSIRLKVKENVSVKSSIIQIKEITASGGAVTQGGIGDVKIEDVNITVNTKVVSKPLINEITNGEVVGETINMVNETTGEIPQKESERKINIGMFFMGIISIITYVKYTSLII